MTADTHSYCSGHMLMRVTGLQEGERKTKPGERRGSGGRGGTDFVLGTEVTQCGGQIHTQGCGGVLADVLLQYCRGQCRILRNSGFID